MSLKKSILLIDCGSDKVEAIQKSLKELNYEFETIPFTVLKDTEVDEYPGVIISGAPMLIADDNPFVDDFSFLKTYENPVLGICFGHQIIGAVFGAGIKKIEADREQRKIEIVHSSIIFNGLTQPVEMQEDHTEEVEVPKDFVLLAKSEKCSNEAMQHRILPIFGVQFHPEASRHQGLQLINNFCKLTRGNGA